MLNKQADLAGPGIGTYEEVAKALPQNYDSLLTPMETMHALYGVKQYIEENLCKELGLSMVQVPLIVDRESGVNDMLDRDGSRTPVEFPCGLGLEQRLLATTGSCLGRPLDHSHRSRPILSHDSARRNQRARQPGAHDVGSGCAHTGTNTQPV